MTSLQATTSTGSVVDQPSVVQLADLVAETDRRGRDAFLFLERRGSDAGDSYLQARRRQDGWVLELRDSGPTRQYRAHVGDAAIVFSVVASWMAGVRAWQDVAWQQLGRAEIVTEPFGGLARAV